MDVLKVQEGVAQSLRFTQGAAISASLSCNGALMKIDISNPEHEAALRWACERVALAKCLIPSGFINERDNANGGKAVLQYCSSFCQMVLL